MHERGWDVLNNKGAEKKPEKPPVKTSRRNFMKALLGAGAAYAGMEAWEKRQKTPEPKNNEETEEETQEEREESSGLIDYDSPRIELTEESMRELKEAWKKKYQEDPGFKRSLADGLKRMSEWDAYLKDVFEVEGVPAEYRLLALPESHFNIAPTSSMGAKGPYQFMDKTAEAYGLTINDTVDERLDPIRAGKACAQFLDDLRKLTGDWDLALSAYNGSFAYDYLRKAKEKKQAVSYAGFLGFMSDKLNTIRDEIKNDKVMHEDEKRAYFYKKIRGITENINYPAKFHAIEEIVKENPQKEKLRTLQFKEISEEEGSLATIALKYHTELSLLKATNPGIKNSEQELPKEYAVRIPEEAPALAKE